ncbi:cation transporter [Bacteroidia bacterium]|nr:cation transporter [Bacteroidia bacterium]
MKTNKILKYVLFGLIFIAGIVIGKLIFNGHSTHDHATEQLSENKTQIWTCSMHPQIRQDHPGKCPICGMDLIPLKTVGNATVSEDPNAVMLSEEAVALANIQTIVVGAKNIAPTQETHLYGTVKPNERLLRSQVSHISGRIEKLVVNTVGESVRPGQIIATVYSPDLLNAQQELLEAKKLGQPALLNAAREKLRSWKLTDNQITEIEKSASASSTINIMANVGGIVTAKRVEQGDYVNQGGVLFDLVDLSSVWVVFDAYESDLPYLKIGDQVDFTLQSLPGKTFSGKISFIDPILDKTTRTAKIRVETTNPKLDLKPEMYANAVVKTSSKQQGNEIVVPKSAVLWTGKRSIVYVKQPDSDMPAFHLREIELGASLGEAYIVQSGLSNGEEVVTSGAFVIDASAQLEGKPSMMNRDNNYELQITNYELKVYGACDMCKERIEKAAKSVAGVSFAEWDDETQQLHLKFNIGKTSLSAISKAVAKAGHDTEKDKAPDVVYNALPPCCQYR